MRGELEVEERTVSLESIRSVLSEFRGAMRQVSTHGSQHLAVAEGMHLIQRKYARFIQMPFFSAMLRGGFYLAQPMYAACHAAYKVSEVLYSLESAVGEDEEALHDILEAQRVCGKVVMMYEQQVDHLLGS